MALLCGLTHGLVGGLTGGLTGCGGGGGAPTPWPYGTDALWSDVAYMMDFRTKADGTGVFTDETANAHATSSVTVSGGKLVRTNNTAFDWSGGSAAFDHLRGDWCVEFWLACDQGVPAVGDNFLFRWGASGAYDWILKVGGTNFIQMYIAWSNTAWNNYNGNTDAKVHSSSLVHYCHIHSAGVQRTFLDGVLYKLANFDANFGAPSPSRQIQSTIPGSFQSMRFTHNTRYALTGFTPDADFGKGLPPV